MNESLRMPVPATADQDCLCPSCFRLGACVGGASDLQHEVPRGLLGLAFAACPSLAASPAAAAAVSILGTWEIVEAYAGAMDSARGALAALTAEGKRLLKLAVTFAGSSVSSKFKLLDCKSNVIYEAQFAGGRRAIPG